jgi:hypothetical protein
MKRRMLSLFLSACLLLTCGCTRILMLFATSELSAENKQKVEIVYAIVPRSVLSKVVDDQVAALTEEAKLLSTDDHRRVITNFSTVVFVTNHSGRSPLTGMLRVWTIGGPVTIEAHSLAVSRRSSVYVIDGGDSGGFFWKKDKRAEWVSLKVLNF